ncbi:TIR domain-containing protein [Ferrovibrio terrae]|uniref:TIR domain-containing protein n=1 Tax=Ferrovibrio terrae TaxID=2594003 RepID=A0A516H2K4_9PROT|nr:toll/interleukin-1 receptor domain-containing protein [Ferrovibrio terrae]QDO98007.1 TIR domain-containing protein [Ferrovibrio terrae]
MTIDAAIPTPALPEPRDILFISKATPGDDDFALWLAPRLEAAGFKVFADILNLTGGDIWRRVVTNTLQAKSVKMLLCCSDDTLGRQGVLEEIDIACQVSKDIKDETFIIPLRLKPYKKIFGIANLNYVNFVPSWADGLDSLLETLKRRGIRPNPDSIQINPNWELYRKRLSIKLLPEPERLTSNWLRVAEAPDAIHYFEPVGSIDRDLMYEQCAQLSFPNEPWAHGFFALTSLEEVNRSFSGLVTFKLAASIGLDEFQKNGSEYLGIRGQDASNKLMSMLRRAWIKMCEEKGLIRYEYSGSTGFHIGEQQAGIGKQISWGRQGERHRSMLRNVARGHVWQYGVTATPNFWPFPHFKLKSRVLFASYVDDKMGDVLGDPQKQHKLRRSVCKGWRNKQWHGRLRAFLELMCGESSYIRIPVGHETFIKLDPSPVLFTSPVSTYLPDEEDGDAEEADETTLGRPDPEEEED